MSALSGLGGPAYKIGGALPFQSGGNPALGVAQLGAGLGLPAGAVQGLNTLAQQYGQSYSSALEQNKALYNNILQGYQQLMSGQQQAQGGIQQGYGQLSNDVMGTIANVGGAAKQNIADVYAQQGGSMQQSMVNRGLGNTTVTDSMQRGLTLDQNKANIALADQMAQLKAGYQSNLGLAGLNYANQANMQNSALGQSQLNWMNSVTAQYPDSGQYNALFGQAGQQHQMNQDRALQQQLMNRRTNPFGGGGGGGQGGVSVGHMPGLNMGGGFGAQDYGSGGLNSGNFLGGGAGARMGQMPGLGAPGLGGQDLNNVPTSYGNYSMPGAGGGGVPDGSGSVGTDMNGDPVFLGQDGQMYYMDGSQANPQDVFGQQQGNDSMMAAQQAGAIAPQYGDPYGDPYAMDPMLIDPTMSGQGYDFSGLGDFAASDYGGAWA